MLTKLTGMPYSKSEGYGAVMYNLLLSRQQQAINNAETVLAEISHGNPAEEGIFYNCSEPCYRTQQILVEESIFKLFSKTQKKTRRFVKYLHFGEFSFEIMKDNWKPTCNSVICVLVQNIMHSIICKMRYNKRMFTDSQ